MLGAREGVVARVEWHRKHERWTYYLADPEVVFFEDFESYGSVDELWDNWFNVFGDLELVSDAPNVLAGSRSLEMTLSPSSEEQGLRLPGFGSLACPRQHSYYRPPARGMP